MWLTLAVVVVVVFALASLYLWLGTKQAERRRNAFASPSEFPESRSERRQDIRDWGELDHTQPPHVG